VNLSVGLNLIFLGERAGGTGRYVRGLMAGLAGLDDPPRLIAFVGSRLPEEVLHEPWAREIDWIRLPAAADNPLNLAAQMAAIPLLAARKRIDVVHSPANVGPLVAPRTATVVTLLDLIWLHYPQDWDVRWRVRFSTRTLSLRCARSADRVIAISEAARDDFVRTIGLNRATVDVTPLAADSPTVEPLPDRVLRERLDLDERPIVLSVAQKRGYKRLDAALRATADLCDQGVALVLVGPPTPHEDELRDLARTLRIADRVRFLDWVTEEELEGLYRSSSCFVLPSLIEGFGLPVLEAMRRGVPVACSNRSSLPEVVGDAALMFDPKDQSQVTAAIRRLITEPEFAQQLARRGRERAAAFSWQRTAKATVESYERAAASRRR
jgi:glycosyltransferase involved in cell wall biosynthesis